MLGKAVICQDVSYEECLRLLGRSERRRRRSRRIVEFWVRGLTTCVCVLGGFSHLFQPDLDYEQVYHWEPTPLGVAWLFVLLLCVRIDRLVRNIWKIRASNVAKLELLVNALAQAGRR